MKSAHRPLTPDPSPRGGEGSRYLAYLEREPLTLDPSRRWGEEDWRDAGLRPDFPE
jgi:hypothetical protein